MAFKNNIMYLRKRAKTWSVEARKNGKRFYKGGFRTKKEAKEYASSKKFK